jgi:hypothetical protein
MAVLPTPRHTFKCLRRLIIEWGSLHRSWISLTCFSVIVGIYIFRATSVVRVLSRSLCIGKPIHNSFESRLRYQYIYVPLTKENLRYGRNNAANAAWRKLSPYPKSQIHPSTVRQCSQQDVHFVRPGRTLRTGRGR